MLLRHLVGGTKTPSLESNKIDAYCEKLCATLWDDAALVDKANEAVTLLTRSVETFAGDKSLAPRLRSFTQHITPTLPQRPRGFVKYYNLERGFGFIERTGMDDVFVHYTAIKGKLDRYLRIGEQVEFDIVQTERGPQAQNVQFYQD